MASVLYLWIMNALTVSKNWLGEPCSAGFDCVHPHVKGYAAPTFTAMLYKTVSEIRHKTDEILNRDYREIT